MSMMVCRLLILCLLVAGLIGCEGLSNPGAWDRAMQLQHAATQLRDGIDHYYDEAHYLDNQTRSQRLARNSHKPDSNAAN